MIKNIAIKKLLMNTVFKGFSWVNRLVPKKEEKILLYANEGFRDNTKYLFDYLIEQGYNQKYEIVCAASDYKKYNGTFYENVRFTSTVRGIFEYLSSGHIYYSFGRIPIVPARNQITIQMWHGTSFKGFDKSTQKTNSKKQQFYTYVFASSEFFKPIVEKKFACNPENVYVCGHPRTDLLFRDDIKYNLGKFEKIIIWLPTFRKSKELGYTDVETDCIVPFYKADELNGLNDYLKNRNVKLIIKLHPLQDIDGIDLEQLSNVQLLTHSQFVKNGYDLYVLLRQTDALITDYSSVFYDYLLLDRPIGFTEDDVDQYESNRGFAVDNPNEFKPGMRIKSKDELIFFINSVAEERDSFRNKRKEINDLSNQYQDGNNCKRALIASNIKIN